MRELIDNIVFFLIVLVIVGVVYIVITEYIKGLEKQNLQKVTYNECIKTDYDKFQCYSMIYGDK